MKDAFADSLIELLPNLRRYAMSLCRRPEQADDLVQTTVERAFAARDRLDPDARLGAWLFRILRNAHIDSTRRARTRGPMVDLEDAPEASLAIAGDAAETRLMLGAASSAMATLPPEQQEVLLLVCVEELSYAEAAEVLGIPKGTVMSRLSRARLAIAEKLGIK